MGYSNGPDLFSKLYNNAVGMIILSAAGSLPGYWIAIFTIDTVGRKTLQIFGFVVLTIIFAVIGFAYHRLSSGSLLALYVIAQFFFNIGPNTTTFIVPGECFPTRYRATGHGLSAAAGKLGAIVAQVVSIPMLTRDSPECTGTPACSPWLGALMRLFALFMLCGTLASLLVPETKGLTLEELAGEPPTSYNAGRNGSIGALTQRGGRRHGLARPFLAGGGGKPAGFAYPRTGAALAGGGGDTEMLAEDKPSPARTKGWWRRERRYGSGANSRCGNGSSSSSTRPFNESAGLGRPGGTPGWTAGWGRIDRGAAPDNIHLHDVGGLIH